MSLREVREGSGGPFRGLMSPPGRPERVGRPCQRSRRVWEVLPKVQEGSRGPSIDLGRVGRTSHRSWRAEEVWRPSRWFGRGWEALPEVWEG